MVKKKSTIGALVHALIDLEYDNHRILACVKAAFPDGDTKLHNISWYRSEKSRAELSAKSQEALSQ
jgi:hypothetical protein